jgi:hypothetical protein
MDGRGGQPQPHRQARRCAAGCGDPLAADLIADVRQLDQRIATVEARVKIAVAHCTTSLLAAVGVGPGLARCLGQSATSVGSPASITVAPTPASPHGRPPAARASAIGCHGPGPQAQHALSMMAMVQVRRPSAGQADDQRKLVEATSPKEALRCRTRRLSDAVPQACWPTITSRRAWSGWGRYDAATAAACGSGEGGTSMPVAFHRDRVQAREAVAGEPAHGLLRAADAVPQHGALGVEARPVAGWRAAACPPNSLLPHGRLQCRRGDGSGSRRRGGGVRPRRVADRLRTGLGLGPPTRDRREQWMLDR